MSRRHFNPLAEREERSDEPREAPTCRRCGVEELEWIDVGMGRWRLYEGQKPHVCPDTTMHHFEDLTR